MEGQIVDVEYECGLIDICKIISVDSNIYSVKPLVYDPDLFLYKFSHYTHQVPIESVSGFYDTTELGETGRYVKENDSIYYRSLDESDPEFEYDTDDVDESESESYEGSEISLYDDNRYEYE
jgi:hypothetical protein|tara:strand:- start:2205 stop:2570 length:366 start_codon:yes stop_codon:yes gene_type:complete